MRIVLAVVLGLVALAALFFVVAGVVITMSGIRSRRGVKGDIALTGFFVVCFVLAAGGSALIALPYTQEQAERRLEEQRQETPRPDQPQTESRAEQRTGGNTTAQPDPSLALDCKDFTSQEAAQKALDQDLEDPKALDPDADGTACEALDDPKPKPGSEKGSEKQSESKKEPDKEPEPDEKSEPEKETESKKGRGNEPEPREESGSENKS